MIDTTKAANVIFTHGGEPRDWEGYLLQPRERDGAGKPLPLAPLAAIPTTAGTGSEASWAAVVKDRSENLKFQIGDFTMFPDVAILDPAATETLPAPIAAATGMDALTHAIEGYVSTERNSHTDAFALQAIRMIRDNLERAVADTSDSDARGNMLVAANLAIAADRLRGDRDHPLDVASVRRPLRRRARGRQRDQPPVGDRVQRRRRRGDRRPLPRRSARSPASTRPGAARRSARRWPITSAGSGDRLGLPSRLSEVGVPEDGIPALVEGAIGDGCTLVNPREPTEEDFAELYAKAL